MQVLFKLDQIRYFKQIKNNFNKNIKSFMHKNKLKYVGRYYINLNNCLGEGAFGKVYPRKDRNNKIHEELAIKEIKLESHN